MIPKRLLPTGTVTFLFTDIEGSTERWDADRAAMQDALRRHDALMRDVIESHNGYIFKTVGDAFCAVFSTTSDALQAAVTAQRALCAENWDTVSGLRVRMALHHGVSDERDHDYFGPTLNTVARILAVAHGTQIVMSGIVANLAQGALPAHGKLRDLGYHQLKGLVSRERIFQLVLPDLPEDFPPLRSLNSLPNNLPRQLTSFIGQKETISEIKSLVAQASLVTLVGSGGIGKTRAALQSAVELLEAFPDGVWLAEFAPISDPKLVVSTIASLFNVEDTGGPKPLIDTLVRSLKNSLALIVLDNCEHVIAAAADAVDRILRYCPNVRILATSREPLRVAGEQAYHLPFLPVPPATSYLSADEAIKYDAVALFAARAQSVQKNFALTDTNASVVADIVRRLDGIALAIELAAPRTNVLSVEQLAQRLDERFNILTGGSRSAMPRQQTLRALIAWSYDLLNDRERMLLRTLSVFRGGCNLQAACEVCAEGGEADWQLLNLLGALVDKSLLVTEQDGAEQRYRLLESTREFAAEQLEHRNESQNVAHRYCTYFCALAERASNVYWETNTHEWLSQARSDLENYRAAIHWGLLRENDVESGAAIVANLAPLWYDAFRKEGRELVDVALRILREDAPEHLRGCVLFAAASVRGGSGQQREMLERAVEIFKTSGDRLRHAVALRMLAYTLQGAGRLGEAQSIVDEALAEARVLQIPRLVALTLVYKGTILMDTGLRAEANALLQEAVALLLPYGDRQRTGTALSAFAELRFAQQDVAGAVATIREALAICRQLRSESRMSTALANLAAYLLAQGAPREAWRGAREALELSVRAGDAWIAAITLQHLAECSARNGDSLRAARLVGFGDRVYEREGSAREPTEQRGYERIMGMLHDSLSQEQLDAALAEGATLDEASAVAQALAIPEPNYGKIRCTSPNSCHNN